MKKAARFELKKQTKIKIKTTNEKTLQNKYAQIWLDFVVTNTHISAIAIKTNKL